MSKAVLISIHPEHVACILSGRKVFEYRKVMPIQDVSLLVLYCTAPIKMVVAVVEVAGLLVGSPSKIWADTAYGSGITRKFYRDYFSGYEKAGAFELGNIYELSNRLELSSLTSCKVAPQSFCYLNTRDTKLILKKMKSTPAAPPSLVFVGKKGRNKKGQSA
jgi:predicted transcriptional regulator